MFDILTPAMKSLAVRTKVRYVRLSLKFSVDCEVLNRRAGSSPVRLDVKGTCPSNWPGNRERKL